MNLNFALVGNQNCGKTTLFNALTGSSQHVGNFPGVTVEKKEGEIRFKKGVKVVDLPGIYSLSPYTAEEVVTRDLLLNEKVDAIINIVDATNLERNLYLTLQLMELRLPIVLALNMMDEADANGLVIDILGLHNALGIEVVPISANKEQGIDELVNKAVKAALAAAAPQKLDFCTGSVHKAIHSIKHLIEERCANKNLPARYVATKLVEGDEPTMKLMDFGADEAQIIESIVGNMEKELQTDREAALADMRYEFIDKICGKYIKRPAMQTHEQSRSVNIDKILTHRVFAIPIFLLIMLLIFWLTFGVIGSALSAVMGTAVDALTAQIDGLLVKTSVAPAIRSLVIDGVFAGVGSVLSFLPTILVLFLMLSILEDTGYMARVAFVMDKLLRKIGLSGRSFVPMLIGFGCSVPAIMATRTLPSERDRKMTMLLVPFMSCSAKLPIYVMITEIFFKENKAIVMVSLYVIGIIVGILYGLFFKSTVFKSEPVPFVMELPAYRFPSARSVMLHIWQRAKDFLTKAFTVIFFASIVIWFLRSLDFGFNLVEDSADSMLAFIGSKISPIFRPLGFGDWRISTALLTGLSAKEAVVSTLIVLTGAPGDVALGSMLSSMLTPLSAFSFLVFTLLYMPCVAAVSALRRELGSRTGALVAMLSQTGIAWIVSFCVFNIGKLCGF
ncbi:MAG: ferrous iron transport protein B [Oscillospiraceae bacterium]